MMKITRSCKLYSNKSIIFRLFPMTKKVESVVDMIVQNENN